MGYETDGGIRSTPFVAEPNEVGWPAQLIGATVCTPSSLLVGWRHPQPARDIQGLSGRQFDGGRVDRTEVSCF